MNNSLTTQQQQAVQSGDIVVTMATEAGLSPQEYYQEVRANCLPANNSNISDARFYTFLSLAKKYDLNPMMREIYFMPGKGGKWQPVVGYDGMLKMANSHPDCDGIEIEVNFNEAGELVSATGIVKRKSWSGPAKTTEYLQECKRNTDPWRQYPIRMLKIKALMQAIRIAFGTTGILDSDEYERHLAAEQPKEQPQQREEKEVVSVGGADLDEVLFHIAQSETVESLEALKDAIMNGRFDLAESDMQVIQAQYGMRMQAIMASAPAIEQGGQQ